jgi:hypothetical protein
MNRGFSYAYFALVLGRTALANLGFVAVSRGLMHQQLGAANRGWSRWLLFALAAVAALGSNGIMLS